MKNVKIKYNPYTKTTEVVVDGQKPELNSSLNFGEKRLQEWAGEIPFILSQEKSDHNFEIEFTGTLADFEDLKKGFSSASETVSVISYKHHRMPDVSETENEVDKLFEEIKNGPVPQLKDQSIIQAFEKAKNQRFEVNVVATMSSGKSTLINALLDCELMPVANEATTAIVVSVIDTERNGFGGVAYDKDNNEIARAENLSYEKMEEWNSNKDISYVEIEGRIPCVNAVGMKLVLIDTPGPNNSADKRHKDMTYEMLADSDKSLVLFVMRADSLAVDDEKIFLDYVCDVMKKGGKQSRDRYIFAINKLDLFNPAKESFEDALAKVKENLERRGIYNPNIFPVSAQAALEARTKPVRPRILGTFKEDVKDYPSTHFDAYYQFSHLPNLVRIETELFLKEAANNPDKMEGEYTNIEIHSGIVSIEKAIELYINKYARTIKVYDLVQSFNNRLKELAAIATLEQDIKDNAEKKRQLEEAIDVIKRNIRSGESACQLSALVEDIDITDNVRQEIEEFVDSQRTKINKIIFNNKNSSKVPKSEAVSQARNIDRDSKDILSQLKAQIDKILKNTYIALYKTIVKQYESYVKDLGVSVDNKALLINPLNFVATNLADLDSVLRKETTRKDEGCYQNKIVRESYQEKKTNWFWEPWNWGTTRYETKYRDKTVKEWVSDYKEYVNMTEVVNKYFEPIQIQLTDAKESAMKHVASETARIKKMLNIQLGKINDALAKKLDELQNTINDANVTTKELETKQNNLKWMNSIIERINKLINF